MASTEVDGGRFRPLSEHQVAQINAGIREILATIGLSGAPEEVVHAVSGHGGALSADGRLLFPSGLVDRALADLARPVRLYAQNEEQDLELGGLSGFVGSGGASPDVVDLETGRFRPAVLRDLFDAARLCDRLPHVQFFARSLVARDMACPRALDLNTAFACLTGTTKHVMTSASQPGHVGEIAEIAHAVAGGQKAFRARPILSMNINIVVPPLRFHAESCAVMAAAIRAGIPVHANIFGQVGASSPVTAAGSVAQTMAEAIAGMIVGWSIDPSAQIICGPRPMVTDLRTGGMSGGSGEQALATAVAAQMAGHFGLPNSAIAGATDSKAPDAQAGAEKALSVALALQAGAHLVTQAAGTQAALMATGFESYVIDNDMLGAVLRAAGPVEVDRETLALDTIRTVVAGEGHFLGQPETYRRMSSDFLYPDLFDRRTAEAWEEAGAPDLCETARSRAREILREEPPAHVPADLRRALIARFGLVDLWV